MSSTFVPPGHVVFDHMAPVRVAPCNWGDKRLPPRARRNERLCALKIGTGATFVFARPFAGTFTPGSPVVCLTPTGGPVEAGPPCAPMCACASADEPAGPLLRVRAGAAVDIAVRAVRAGGARPDGAAEGRLLQLGAGEVGPGQVGIGETRFLQVGAWRCAYCSCALRRFAP